MTINGRRSNYIPSHEHNEPGFPTAQHSRTGSSAGPGDRSLLLSPLICVTVILCADRGPRLARGSGGFVSQRANEVDGEGPRGVHILYVSQGFQGRREAKIIISPWVIFISILELSWIKKSGIYIYQGLQGLYESRIMERIWVEDICASRIPETWTPGFMRDRDARIYLG